MQTASLIVNGAIYFKKSKVVYLRLLFGARIQIVRSQVCTYKLFYKSFECGSLLYNMKQQGFFLTDVKLIINVTQK